MSPRRTQTPTAPRRTRAFRDTTLNAALVPVIAVQHAIGIVPGGVQALVRALHGGVEVYEGDGALFVSLSALSLHGEVQQKEVA